MIGLDKVSADIVRRTEQQMIAERDEVVEKARHLLEQDKVAEAREALAALEFGTVDEKTLQATDPWLRAMAGGRTIVASCDPTRRPGAGEVVIIYGNYPHTYENVVVNNPIRRHVADFWELEHDIVEHDERWAGVDRIFVINLQGRPDRLDSVMRELAQAAAPLDRVSLIRASTPRPGDPDYLGGSLACLRSHSAALRSALEMSAEHVLILEDDFIFSSDVEQHLDDLRGFLDRGYDYWVCLVSSSKYGHVLPNDDLVNTTYQECTNAGGYLISRAGLSQVLPLFRDSHERLGETGEPRFAADRCWAVLQPSGKFLAFRHKWGFQAANFSDIEGEITRTRD